MILNDFRVETARKLINGIKALNDSELIIKIDFDIESYKGLVKVNYYDYLHRIDVIKFDPYKEELYCNPDYIDSTLPIRVFIKKMIPNDVYRQIINSQFDSL